MTGTMRRAPYATLVLHSLRAASATYLVRMGSGIGLPEVSKSYIKNSRGALEKLIIFKKNKAMLQESFIYKITMLRRKKIMQLVKGGDAELEKGPNCIACLPTNATATILLAQVSSIVTSLYLNNYMVVFKLQVVILHQSTRVAFPFMHNISIYIKLLHSYWNYFIWISDIRSLNTNTFLLCKKCVGLRKILHENVYTFLSIFA